MRPIIQKPCHEQWQSLSPNSTGRFCKLCQKTVVDFTEMSDDSIMNYLQQNKDEKTCGRFKTRQLDIPITTITKQTQKINYVQMLLTGVVAFITSCFGGQQPRNVGETSLKQKKDTTEHLLGDTILREENNIYQQKNNKKKIENITIEENNILGEIEVPIYNVNNPNVPEMGNSQNIDSTEIKK